MMLSVCQEVGTSKLLLTPNGLTCSMGSVDHLL